MGTEIMIGEVIRREFEKTGWSVSYFAEKIHKDRTIAYHIFKRRVVDTGLLYEISLALNVDLFSLYSQALSRENASIRRSGVASGSGDVPRRRVLLEVEVTEEEYRRLLEKREG